MVANSHARLVLVLFVAIGTMSKAQFSTATPGQTQETQVRGYWTDPATGLMWSAKDNGKRVSWHRATRYCRNLRLDGNSDWRLATIDELEGLVNLKAYATEHIGSSDILHWNGDLKVNGGLQLTGDRQWSSSSLMDVDGRPVNALYWIFDVSTGRRMKGFEDWAEGDTAYSLCVRDSNSVRSASASPSAQGAAHSSAQNEKPVQEAQSPAAWTDSISGLMWAVNDNGRDVNLGEAMKYCRDRRLEHSSDWRLATIEELEALRQPNREAASSANQPKDPFTTYRLPEEISLTGDPWSSSPASDARGYFAIEWYLSMKSKTRVFDEPSYSRARRALCVRSANVLQMPRHDASNINVQSSSADQEPAQDTQKRGYWIDPSTGLMWAGRDNFHRFIIYTEATKYCQDLRLAHFPDWRLATIGELQGIYDPSVFSAGADPRDNEQDPAPRFFHAKGNLFLTGMQWVSESPADGENTSKFESFFDFRNGQLVKDEHHSIRERRALCVRNPAR